MSSEIINDNNNISSNVEGTELLQVDVHNEISKKPVVVTDKKKKRKNKCEEGAVNKLKTNEVKIKIEGEKETSKKRAWISNNMGSNCGYSRLFRKYTKRRGV